MGNFSYADNRRGRSRAGTSSDSSPEATRDGRRKVRITLQFRERHNLTYEIDCDGIPLVLRVFFAVGEGAAAQWRVEARAGHVEDPSIASATEPSRAQALESIAKGWRASAAPEVSSIDWDGVTRAMTAVRAI